MVKYKRKRKTGDGQSGGWLRSNVEAPTCETFTRLCEKPSCASSTSSHLTHLRKLAPHFTHIEPSPIFHFFSRLKTETGRWLLTGEHIVRDANGTWRPANQEAALVLLLLLLLLYLLSLSILLSLCLVLVACRRFGLSRGMHTQMGARHSTTSCSV